MSGVLLSIDQGTGHDVATIADGDIGSLTGADAVTITGGTVGSIGLEAGNVVMNGGTVRGDVLGVAADDVLVLSNGTIGGHVGLGDGANRIDVRGGAIGAGVSTGSGNDQMQW